MAEETPGTIITDRLYAAKKASKTAMTRAQMINIIDAIIKELRLRRPKKFVEGRNELFDALCVGCGVNPNEVTVSQASAIGTALADIVAVSPDVTAEEFQIRANKYRKIYADTPLTPNALASHWGELWVGNTRQAVAIPPPAIQEPAGWREWGRNNMIDPENANRSWDSFSRVEQQYIAEQTNLANNPPCHD